MASTALGQIRICDFTGQLAGAGAPRFLAAFGAQVIRITRIRTRDGAPFIAETIALPEALFPGLVEQAEMPNTLYDLFQKAYGVLVTRTDDHLSAVAADTETAAALGVAQTAEVLNLIERVRDRNCNKTAPRGDSESYKQGIA